MLRRAVFQVAADASAMHEACSAMTRQTGISGSASPASPPPVPARDCAPCCHCRGQKVAACGWRGREETTRPDRGAGGLACRHPTETGRAQLVAKWCQCQVGTQTGGQALPQPLIRHQGFRTETLVYIPSQQGQGQTWVHGRQHLQIHLAAPLNRLGVRTRATEPQNVVDSCGIHRRRALG